MGRDAKPASSSMSGTSQGPHKSTYASPTLSRAERAKRARTVLNQTVPALLRSNARARNGVEAAKLVVDPPSLEDGGGRPQGKNPAAGNARQGGDNAPSSGAASVPADEPDSTPPSSSPPPRPRVLLQVVDTFFAARQLAALSAPPPPSRAGGKQGPDKSSPRRRVAVLNMASPLRPGGGVLSGASSQEESLCARSTLYPSLREEWYRLPDVGGIYTPDVLVFGPVSAGSGGVEGGEEDGDGEEHGYDKSEMHESADGAGGKTVASGSSRAEPPPLVADKLEWFYVDIITSAMLRFPDVVQVPQPASSTRATKTVYAEDKDRELARRKMRAVLRMACAHGASHLVLGAWGCGAYGNPVAEMAEGWRRVLLGKEGGKQKSSDRGAELAEEKRGRTRRAGTREESWDGLELVVFAINDARMAAAFAEEFGPQMEVGSLPAVGNELANHRAG